MNLQGPAWADGSRMLSILPKLLRELKGTSNSEATGGVDEEASTPSRQSPELSKALRQPSKRLTRRLAEPPSQVAPEHETPLDVSSSSSDEISTFSSGNEDGSVPNGEGQSQGDHTIEVGHQDQDLMHLGPKGSALQTAWYVLELYELCAYADSTRVGPKV